MKNELRSIVEDRNKGRSIQMHGRLISWPPEFKSGDEWVAHIIQYYGSDLMSAYEDLVKWPGAFSVVVRDYQEPGKNPIVHMFTDMLGQDQLYFTILELGKSRNDVVVAPTVRELAEFLGCEEPDALYMASVAKFGYHIGCRTYAPGVYRAKPLAITTVDPNTVRVSYTHGKLNKMLLPPSEHLSFSDTLLISFERNVIWRAQRGELDEGLTVLVSGGLDSSVMAHLVMDNVRAGGPLSRIPLQFLTIVNGEDAGYANMLAEAEGFDLEFLPAPDEEGEYLEQAITAADSPIDLGSLIPNFRLIAAAKHRHILTGDGPDELLGGYARMKDYDSQQSDIFHELSYYHLPKLNQTASWFNKTLICPYLDPAMIAFALYLPLESRTNKRILKEFARGMLPCAIIDRDKFALKSGLVRKDKVAHRMKCLDLFRKIFFQNSDHDENTES